MRAPVMQTPVSSFQPVKPNSHYRKPVRGSLVWWLRFLGIVAFFVLLWRLPRSEGAKVTSVDLRWLGVCMLLTIVQLLLEAFAWQWLLSTQRIRHPYPKTLLAYVASQYLGLVTPGHVGEFLAAGYISTETGITFGYALSSVFMKKVLTWTTVVGFGIWGLQLLPEVPLLRGMQWAVLMSVLVLVVFSAGMSLWVFSLQRLARKWEKLSPWQVNMTEFRAGLRSLFSLRLIAPLGLTALAFSLLFLQIDGLLRALGVTLPLVLVAKIVAFSRIVARAIPLSVVGFGSKDAALIGMLSQHGVEPATGVTVAILFLLCSYLVTLLLSGLSWWIKPLVIRRVA